MGQAAKAVARGDLNAAKAWGRAIVQSGAKDIGRVIGGISRLGVPKR